MPIYLPESADALRSSAAAGSAEPSIEALTPREIVAELDKYVISQGRAKRAVAIALRNRMRRQQLSPDLAEEVAPKNILMIGPTGVGKTEIARRLARLAQSPFIKVEASKFTEVGYVGRDVESMVRDLVELAVEMLREERLISVRLKARENAESRLLDLLLPPLPPSVKDNDPGPATDHHERTRARLRTQLDEGRLDEREVDVEVPQKGFPSLEVISLMNALRRSSNSPRYFAPAIIALRSIAISVLLLSDSGTSPLMMRRARPSAMAVLPTPGSPMSTGLFFVRRLSTCITRRISASRPMIGSILPCLARAVRSRPYFSSA